MSSLSSSPSRTATAGDASARQAGGSPQLPNRRQFLCRSGVALTGSVGLLSSGLLSTGCVPQNRGPERKPNLDWGRKGLSDGRLMKPRAMEVGPKDELYIVDITGRIQVFTADGEFIRGWRTPMIKQGKPTGLGMSRDGSLLVADTHYFRVLFYSAEGELDESRTIGGQEGDGPGQFHFVTDVAEDARGHFFVGQYGQIDRIQEFAPDGQFLRTWGSQGSGQGEFSRPQSLMIDQDGLLWIADACNHRIQVYDVQHGGLDRPPQLVKQWGSLGQAPGQLQFPYGLVFDRDRSILIADYGNHRIQRFSPDGELLDYWGTAGAELGQFNSPWALALDSKRRLHVLDTLNHRMQRFDLA